MLSRPSGVVYFAGENSIPHARGNVEEEAKSPNHLPADPSKVIELVDQALVNRLLTSAAMTSPLLDVRRGAVLEKAQLCYRPTTPDGDPLIGRLGQDGDGLFVATGHGPWVRSLHRACLPDADRHFHNRESRSVQVISLFIPDESG